LVQHAGREIEAEDGCASIAQVAGYVTGAAAHVADFAAFSGLFGEAVEECAIERLVLEFAGDAAGVFFGEAIVAFADGVGRVVVHW